MTWLERVQAERQALEEGGIPKEGDATGWIIMVPKVWSDMKLVLERLGYRVPGTMFG